MPFKNIKELPKNVKTPLPVHGQEIFLAAFNSAWEQYKSKSDRRDDDTREETAMKIAWAAVKNSYKKINGEWKPKNP